MNWLRQQFRDFIAVLRDGFSALARNLPSLLAVFLCGYSIRMGILWLAGKVATYSTAAAALMLPLAPLALIVSLIVMFRIAATSFPSYIQGPSNFSAAVKTTLLVILPFLAIYASNGFLKQDMRRYIQDQTGIAWARVDAGDFSSTVFDRAGLPVTGLLLAVVVIALLMRKLIVWKELSSRALPWAILAAYLEALWMMSAGFIFSDQVAAVKNWLFTRSGAEDVVYWWNEASGFYGTYFIKPANYIASLISPFTTLVVVPVAWLAVGATIYGSSLKAGAPILDAEAVSAQIERIPNPVRRTVGHIVEPAITPVRAAANAIRKIAVAGLVPMLLFCLIFVLSGWLRIGVRNAFHYLIGPRPEKLVFALEPYAALLDSLVYFPLVITLVAAAVNVVISRQRQPVTAN